MLHRGAFLGPDVTLFFFFQPFLRALFLRVGSCSPARHLVIFFAKGMLRTRGYKGKTPRSWRLSPGFISSGSLPREDARRSSWRPSIIPPGEGTRARRFRELTLFHDDARSRALFRRFSFGARIKRTRFYPRKNRTRR